MAKGLYTAKLSKAQRKTGKALNVFKQAKVKLEKETNKLNDVIDEIDKEIAELRDLRDATIAEFNKNDKLLYKLLDFLGLDD